MKFHFKVDEEEVVGTAMGGGGNREQLFRCVCVWRSEEPKLRLLVIISPSQGTHVIGVSMIVCELGPIT